MPVVKPQQRQQIHPFAGRGIQRRSRNHSQHHMPSMTDDMGDAPALAITPVAKHNVVFLYGEVRETFAHVGRCYVYIVTAHVGQGQGVVNSPGSAGDPRFFHRRTVYEAHTVLGGVMRRRNGEPFFPDPLGHPQQPLARAIQAL